MQNSVAKKLFAVGSAVAMAVSLSLPMVAFAAVHADGTNVSDSSGTVYMIVGGQRRPYTSAGAFLSYGFNSWSSVVPANSDDLALPVGSFIPPQDGKIFCATATKGSDVKGECSLITGGQKAAFTSAANFTGRGFSFSRAQYGDSSFLTKTSNINDTTSANMPGVLINNNGTVQLRGANGNLGIPDLATFNSWGYSFADVVPANAADKAMSQSGVMAARMPGQLSPSWTTTGGNTGGTTPPATSGAVSVSLASNNPAAGNFPGGASKVPMLAVNFTAGAQAVTVTGLNVYRGGLSSDNDITNLYLMNGPTVVATNIGLASGKATFSQSNGLFTVPANSTKTITVAADISSTNTASHTYMFSINSAADVVTGGSVSGSFPITGNSMTAVSVSNPSLATLNVGHINTGSTVNAGTTGFLAGQFQLTANNSSVQVKSIKLTETGTVNASTDLVNIKLMNGGTQVGSTAANLNSDGTVVFDLSSNPLQLSSGQNVTLSVYADVASGVNRTFQFTIQRTYDINAVDMTYNVGATVQAGNGDTSFPISDTSVTVQKGSITMTKDASSPVNYVAPGANNATIGMFDVKASGEAVRVTSVTITLARGTTGAENADFNNLKLVDDQGVQIGTTYTSASSSNNSTSQTFSNLNYIIPAGTTRVWSVKADIASGSTNTFTASAQINASGAQGYTSLADLTGGSAISQSANALSASNTSFSQSLNNALGSVTTVAGASSVKVASFALTAGPAEGLNLSTVTITSTSTGATKFQNLKVMVGSQQLGNTQATLANGTAYTFSASPLVAIPVGGSVVVDVYADVISGNTFGPGSVVSLTGAQATGAVTNTSRTLNTTTVGQSVTVNASGTITTAASSPATPSAYVAMGNTGVVLGSFKLSANNNENLNVTSLELNDTVNSTSTGKELVNIRLMNGSTQVGTAAPALNASSTSATTYTYTFTLPAPVAGSTSTNGSLQVPQNSYVTLSVVADINSFVNGAQSNTTHQVFLGPVIYQGAQSGTSKTDNTRPSAGTTITVFRSGLNVAGVTSDSANSYPNNFITDNKVVAEFAFTNTGPNDDATVNSIVINATGAAASSTASVTYTAYDSANPTVSIGSQAITGTATGTLTLSTPFVLQKGAPARNLIIKANLATAGYKTNNPAQPYGVNLDAVSWNDGTTGGIGLSPTIVTPISGASMSF